MDVLGRQLIVAGHASAAGIAEEAGADAPHPLEMGMPAGKPDGVVVVQIPQDGLVGRGGQDNIVKGGGRAVKTEQDATLSQRHTHGGTEGRDERLIFGSEVGQGPLAHGFANPLAPRPEERKKPAAGP